MSTSFDEVLRAATGLPEPDRVHLIESLMATLGSETAAPLDDVWLAEIDRRSREFDAGEVELIPWSEVKQHARQRLQKHG